MVEEICLGQADWRTDNETQRIRDITESSTSSISAIYIFKRGSVSLNPNASPYKADKHKGEK